MCGSRWNFDPSDRTLDLSVADDAVWIGVHGDAQTCISYLFAGTGTITLYGFDGHLLNGTTLGATASATGTQTLDTGQYDWLKVQVTTDNAGSVTVGYSREEPS